MKILIVRPWGRTAFELAGFCKNALQDLGHNAYLFTYNDERISSRISLFAPMERALIKKALLNRIIKFRPELVLVIKGDRIPPEIILQIRKEFKIPLANYWIDDPYRIEISRKISPLYDYFFTNDNDSIRIHKDAGCPRVGFLTFGFDPRVHKKIPLSKEEAKLYGSDICFSGTVSTGRTEFLESLADFDIKIWAKPYVYHLAGDYKTTKKPILPNSPLYDKFTKKAVWGAELAKVYNAAKIVLNIHSPQGCPIMRDFEATGCGAFLLTDYVKGLADSFKIGEEIVCYTHVNELREAIRFYLKQPEQRNAIAQRGQKRACSAHTYVQRMQELISFITGK